MTVAATLASPVSAEDQILGAGGGGLELVVYGDFSCPHSTAAAPALASVRAGAANRLLFAFRHFPGPDPIAWLAAQAAEAAGSQGAFWEMHDRLFESGGAFTAGFLRAHAAALGLNLARFESELESEVHVPRIARDVETARASGVAGTPAVFIAGREYEGPLNAPSLLAALDASI